MDQRITEAVKDTIHGAHTKTCSGEILSTLMLQGKRVKRKEERQSVYLGLVK
jgi:hypothetical protein